MVSTRCLLLLLLLLSLLLLLLLLLLLSPMLSLLSLVLLLQLLSLLSIVLVTMTEEIKQKMEISLLHNCIYIYINLESVLVLVIWDRGVHHLHPDRDDFLLVMQLVMQLVVATELGDVANIRYC